MTRRTIIRNGRLLDLGGRAAPLRDVLVEDGRIREVGPAGIAAPDDADVFDAAGLLLHPGLVNGHTHGTGSLSRGSRDRYDLALLLVNAPAQTAQQSTEIKYLNTYLGAVEMLLKGCTTAFDLTFGVPLAPAEDVVAVGRAYRDAGMRAVVAPMIADLSVFRAVPGLYEALPEEMSGLVHEPSAGADAVLAAMRAALASWPHDRAFVRLGVAPTIPLHCTDALFTGAVRLAREFGTVVQSHVGEAKFQAIAAMQRWGVSIVAHLDGLGALGPDFSVAHGVWLDADDMRRLADAGASVSHNPGANMRLGSGIADARGLIEAGVNLAIGTDGSASSDNQNMYEAMRSAFQVAAVRQPDMTRWLTGPEIVGAATRGGATATGFAEVGAIEPGKRADIVFLALDHPNWMPVNDAAAQLVLVEDGTAVRHVMVDGRLVVRDGRHLGSDMGALAAKAEAARAELARLQRPALAAAAELEPFVESFCLSLAARPYMVERFASCPHCARRDGFRAEPV
jgi:5-methylthioadenosine/S-adenosylhomocysteine deaminase